MEARSRRVVGTTARTAFTSFLFGSLSLPLFAAPYTTTNFVVHAPTERLARQLGDAAEEYRRTLAQEWLGHELPAWNERCPIEARIARGDGGWTSFNFTRGNVHGWQMEIQGSPERMLDSVLPHEVTHTVFATHFRRPLPRWADEGACTTEEHPGEIARMERELIRFLRTKRGIRFSDMMWMKQYPRDFMPLYAQGHSVAQFLISQRDKRTFIRFLEDGLRDENWPRAARDHYGYAHLREMQDQWLDWVRAGRPTQDPATSPESYATVRSDTSSNTDRPRAGGEVVARGQELVSTSPTIVRQVAQPAEPVGSRLLANQSATVVKTHGATHRPEDSASSIVFEWRAPTSATVRR